jgi:hypothetical protein
MHAGYFFDAERRDEYLEIIPLAGYGPPKTRIDLPVAGTSRCRSEMSNRCLLALEDPGYPDDALRARAWGTVTLAGTITRSGKIKGLRAVEARVDPNDRKAPLVKAAVRNLKTWRFESGKRDDPFRFTYRYVTIGSIHIGGPLLTEWAFPNQVTIRGKPPE